jgi:hypothetical protein
MLRALFHFVRMQYYRIALDHVHPTNPDMLLLSQRFIASRNVVDSFLTTKEQ